MVHKVKLILNNYTQHDLWPLYPEVVAWKGTMVSFPRHAQPSEYPVQAGEFKSDGMISTIKCASIYQSPDPNVAIVLFVIVPFVGENKVKCSVVDSKMDFDDNALYVMEQSDRNRDWDTFSYTYRDKKKDFKISGRITEGVSPTAFFSIEEVA